MYLLHNTICIYQVHIDQSHVKCRFVYQIIYTLLQCSIILNRNVKLVL